MTVLGRVEPGHQLGARWLFGRRNGNHPIAAGDDWRVSIANPELAAHRNRYRDLVMGATRSGVLAIRGGLPPYISEA
jgi:hypothetical protein